MDALAFWFCCAFTRFSKDYSVISYYYIWQSEQGEIISPTDQYLLSKYKRPKVKPIFDSFLAPNIVKNCDI